jgi:hypothetical protein
MTVKFNDASCKRVLGAENFFPPVCYPKNNLNIQIHRIVLLPVVLYGCGTWSLTYRQRVFENRVVERNF